MHKVLVLQNLVHLETQKEKSNGLIKMGYRHQNHRLQVLVTMQEHPVIQQGQSSGSVRVETEAQIHN